MVSRLLNTFGSWGAFAAAAVWLTGFLAAHLWPSEWWMSVNRVLVFDSPAGADVAMEVDRTIHRDFTADWSVLVRRYHEGSWVIACAARGTSDYRPDAVLPDPLTLDWWTNGECPSLSQHGRYFISTIWTIRGNMLPDKTIQTASNVFTVE